MRIANFQTGVKATGAGNFMRNLHPLFIYGDKIDYVDSIGFDDQSGGNWYDICYPDNFATGFRMKDDTMSTYNNCYCYWYSINGGVEVGFMSTGKFNSTIANSRVDLRPETDNAFLKVSEPGGAGIVENPCFPEDRCPNKDYKDYLIGRVTWRK